MFISDDILGYDFKGHIVVNGVKYTPVDFNLLAFNTIMHITTVEGELIEVDEPYYSIGVVKSALMYEEPKKEVRKERKVRKHKPLSYKPFKNL